ncbi:plasmid mobilization relaxosome protein MobC [Pseudomonas sp. H1_D04]
MAQDKISIRARKEDIARLNELASSLSITKTKLIKKIVDDGFGQIVEITNDPLLSSFVEIEKMLKSIEDQLTPLGNNINQIARKVNSGDAFTERDRKVLEANFKIMKQVLTRFDNLYDFVYTRSKRIVIKKKGSK